MLRAIIVSVVVIFLALPAFGQIASPPTDNIVDQLFEDGFLPTDSIVSAESMLASEFLVRSKRLEFGAFEVWEKTTKIDGFDGEIKSYHEIVQLEDMGPNGGTLFLVRTLNPEEVARRKAASIGTPEAMAVGLHAYGKGLLLVGGVLSQMVRESDVVTGGDGAGGADGIFGAFGSAAVNQSSGDAESPLYLGTAESCLKAYLKRQEISRPSYLDLPVSPWESADPMYFLTGPACMVLAVAERMGVDLDEAAEDMLALHEIGFGGAHLQDAIDDIVGNRAAHKIVAEGLNFSQPMTSLERDDANSLFKTPAPPSEQFARNSSGNSYSPLSPGHNQSSAFAPLTMSQSGTQVVAANTASGVLTINKMSVWIDAEYFVRLKMRMEGVVEQNGDSREIFLEQQYMDYQTVPGTYLYEPYREVLRVGGLMSPEQQAELQEAAKKLDEYEQQLASMPASQRAMMEKMMGSKMDQFRSMASGGAMEMELITTNFVINPDLGNPLSEGESFLEKSSLVQVIQQHLIALGYDPGKTDGDLIKQTVVAITQFEAKNGMPVTGQATPQLAGVLAAAVDALP